MPHLPIRITGSPIAGADIPTIDLTLTGEWRIDHLDLIDLRRKVAGRLQAAVQIGKFYKF